MTHRTMLLGLAGARSAGRIPALSTAALAHLAAGLLSIIMLAGAANAQTLPDTGPKLPTPDTEQQAESKEPKADEQLPNAAEPGAPNAGGAVANKPARRMTPLDLIMKDGIPKRTDKRVEMRDNLYALLATAGSAGEAKKIAAQIQRVWLTSSSDTVSVLMGRAGRALKSKDNTLALTLLDSVVKLAPDNAEAWNRRAFIHYSSKNYRAAVGDLRRALALDGNHFKALDGLASIFRQLGDDGKALKVYEQLRQIHPHWPGLDKAYETLKGKVEGRGI